MSKSCDEDFVNGSAHGMTIVMCEAAKGLERFAVECLEDVWICEAFDWLGEGAGLVEGQVADVPKAFPE